MNVKGFTRVRKFTLFALLALLMLPSCIQAWGTSVLSVAMDGESYGPGERVEIFGVADPDLEVAILVLDSNMTELYEYNATTDEDGEFSTEYYLQEDAMNGTYLVKVYSGGLEAEKAFEVVGEDVDENAGEEETPDPGSEPGQEPTTNSTDDGTGEPQAEEETSAEDGDGLASSIERAENYLARAAESAAEKKPAAAVARMVEAYNLAGTILERREWMWTRVKKTWEKSRYEKGRSVGRRHFVHVLDDVKDHFADRRPGLEYMIAPFERMQLEQWQAELGERIKQYSAAHDVPIEGMKEPRLED